MAARSPQRPGAEFFIAPGQVNQRRYEALRAYFVDGLSYAEAGARFGCTRWAMVDLARQHRAGKLMASHGLSEATLTKRRNAWQPYGPAGAAAAPGRGRRRAG